MSRCSRLVRPELARVAMYSMTLSVLVLLTSYLHLIGFAAADSPAPTHDPQYNMHSPSSPSRHGGVIPSLDALTSLISTYHVARPVLILFTEEAHTTAASAEDEGRLNESSRIHRQAVEMDMARSYVHRHVAAHISPDVMQVREFVVRAHADESEAWVLRALGVPRRLPAVGLFGSVLHIPTPSAASATMRTTPWNTFAPLFFPGRLVRAPARAHHEHTTTMRNESTMMPRHTSASHLASVQSDTVSTSVSAASAHSDASNARPETTDLTEAESKDVQALQQWVYRHTPRAYGDAVTQRPMASVHLINRRSQVRTLVRFAVRAVEQTGELSQFPRLVAMTWLPLNHMDAPALAAALSSVGAQVGGEGVWMLATEHAAVAAEWNLLRPRTTAWVRWQDLREVVEEQSRNVSVPSSHSEVHHNNNNNNNEDNKDNNASATWSNSTWTAADAETPSSRLRARRLREVVTVWQADGDVQHTQLRADRVGEMVRSCVSRAREGSLLPRPSTQRVRSAGTHGRAAEVQEGTSWLHAYEQESNDNNSNNNSNDNNNTEARPLSDVVSYWLQDYDDRSALVHLTSIDAEMHWHRAMWRYVSDSPLRKLRCAAHWQHMMRTLWYSIRVIFILLESDNDRFDHYHSIAVELAARTRRAAIPLNTSSGQTHWIPPIPVEVFWIDAGRQPEFTQRVRVSQVPAVLVMVPVGQQKKEGDAVQTNDVQHLVHRVNYFDLHHGRRSGGDHQPKNAAQRRLSFPESADAMLSFLSHDHFFDMAQHHMQVWTTQDKPVLNDEECTASVPPRLNSYMQEQDDTIQMEKQHTNYDIHNDNKTVTNVDVLPSFHTHGGDPSAAHRTEVPAVYRDDDACLQPNGCYLALDRTSRAIYATAASLPHYVLATRLQQSIVQREPLSSPKRASRTRQATARRSPSSSPLNASSMGVNRTASVLPADAARHAQWMAQQRQREEDRRSRMARKRVTDAARREEERQRVREEEAAQQQKNKEQQQAEQDKQQPQQEEEEPQQQ